VKKLIKFNSSLSHKSVKNGGNVLYIYAYSKAFLSGGNNEKNKQGREDFFFLLLLS